MRAKLNKYSAVKISVNDFVMKAAAMAAVKVPETNSAWMGDFIRQYNNVNMCFAVSTDHGLMAPSLANVNLKGLEQISTEVKEIADDAQADLDKALPALDAAVKCLKELQKGDIVEVKAMGKPPDGVKLVLQGVR